MTNKTSRHDNFWEVIIIGGGAAGLFCAATAAARGKNVLVLESATKIGKILTPRLTATEWMLSKTNPKKKKKTKKK